MLSPRAGFAALFAFLPALLLTPVLAEDAPTFSGYLTSAPGKLPLLVDGRPLLLSERTQYGCSFGQGRIEIDNGVPTLPPGARLGVVGKWDKAAAAWRTDSLCVQASLKTSSGQGIIDAAARTASGWKVMVNGRSLHIAPDAGVSFQPPLTNASTFTPGRWLQYTAERDKDGFWLVRTATLHEVFENRTTRNERKWKPRLFTPPGSGQEGSFQAERLAPHLKLPGDPALQERVARIGAMVVPAWEQTRPAQAAPNRKFRFYAARQHALDCTGFPDGTILLPESTAKALPEDGQLAAILAGCVAGLEEEQNAQLVNRQLAGNTLETASLVAVSPVGIVATIAYKQHMHHAEELLEQQCMQAALFYLEAAGYPRTAAPAACEKLEAKHGIVDLSRPPGARTSRLYQARAEAQ